MRKKFFLTAVFLAVISVCSAGISYAQPNGLPPDKKDMPDKKEISPEKMAEQMAGMLKRDLNLTDEQYKQVYDIVLDYHSTHGESSFSLEELNAEIEKVLTVEQLDKFEKIKKEQERINKNKEKPSDGPPQGDPPQGKHPRGKPPGD